MVCSTAPRRGAGCGRRASRTRCGGCSSGLFTRCWRRVFGGFGGPVEIDLESLQAAQLFQLHFLFLTTLVFWYALAFGRRSQTPGAAARSFAAQLGLYAPRPGREVAIGLAAGFAGVAGVLAAMLGVAGLIYLVAGPEALPQTPPAVIPWMAALPVALRLALALSAGVVEELFFRGFLQPRIGLLASSGLFVLAHVSRQPLMLVGVALLSLLYGLLVRWRQSLWASWRTPSSTPSSPVVIPVALRYLPGGRSRRLSRGHSGDLPLRPADADDRRRRPRPLVIASRFENIELVVIEDALRQAAASDDQPLDRARVARSAANAIKHGNRQDRPSGWTSPVSPADRIRIRDEGRGSCPTRCAIRSAREPLPPMAAGSST